MNPQKAFKAIHRLARVQTATISAGGVVLRRWRDGGRTVAAQREEIEPRGFYWLVSTQQRASVSDRLFYVRRARGIRRSGYKTIHP